MGDSLNQWRGYCRESAGYAIGFKYDELVEWCIERKLKFNCNSWTRSIHLNLVNSQSDSEDLEDVFSVH